MEWYARTWLIVDIIHEETHTALMLEDEWQVTALNHPNEERRKTYDELHTEWYDVECPSCEAELRICESWENDEYKDVHCHECDAELAVGEDQVSIA